MIIASPQNVPSIIFRTMLQAHFDVSDKGQHLENIDLLNGRFVDGRQAPDSQNFVSNNRSGRNLLAIPGLLLGLRRVLFFLILALFKVLG